MRLYLVPGNLLYKTNDGDHEMMMMVVPLALQAAAASFTILLSAAGLPDQIQVESPDYAFIDSSINGAKTVQAALVGAARTSVDDDDVVDPMTTTAQGGSRSTILGDNYSGRIYISDHAEKKVARIPGCDPQSNCVSSQYSEPPNRYISSYKTVNEPRIAFQRAVKDLQRIVDSNAGGSSSSSNTERISIVEIIPSLYYIHLTVPGSAGPSSLDDIDLVFSRTNNVVDVKCEARTTIPPPPFCLQKNCINGNMDQRRRVERLMGQVLGLPPSDTDEMKFAKWTPIFFNSDRVPGFYDED